MNYISEYLSINEMNKTKVKMNKPIYLERYEYMKPKYGNRVKLCYMDTDSFVMNIKTNDFYKDIANDV